MYFFSKTNNQLTRQAAWSSIPYFQKKINENFNFHRYFTDFFAKKKSLHALTLACGDMHGEYNFFKGLNKVTKIDAFDISEGQRKKFYDRVYDNKIQVDYKIEDCNHLTLEANKYDIIYIQQAYHHLENVDGVAKELNKALRNDGIFLLIDYIGTPFLQRSESQRRVARKIWKELPERLRKNPQGRILKDIYIPNKAHLSPFEAIKSDEIFDAINNNFSMVKSFVYGGILFPLFQGFAQNYTDSIGDELYIKSMWFMDQELIQSGIVEPNFIRAIMRKKT